MNVRLMRTRMDGVFNKQRNICLAYLCTKMKDDLNRLYINRDLSFTGLLCVCALVRIKNVAKNISLLASRMPVRLEFFSSVFFFKYSVLRSINSRKQIKFLPKRLVLLLYGNQYRDLYFVHKTTCLWSIRSPGGGELPLSACPGVGNRPPSEKKIANPRVYARGGW